MEGRLIAGHLSIGCLITGQLSTDDRTKDCETHHKQCAQNIKIDTLFSVFT